MVKKKDKQLEKDNERNKTRLIKNNKKIGVVVGDDDIKDQTKEIKKERGGGEGTNDCN